MKIFEVKVEFDPDFIAIIPTCNINKHSKTLEFEWLVFAIYIDFPRKVKEKTFRYTPNEVNVFQVVDLLSRKHGR